MEHVYAICAFSCTHMPKCQRQVSWVNARQDQIDIQGGHSPLPHRRPGSATQDRGFAKTPCSSVVFVPQGRSGVKPPGRRTHSPSRGTGASEEFTRFDASPGGLTIASFVFETIFFVVLSVLGDSCLIGKATFYHRCHPFKDRLVHILTHQRLSFRCFFTSIVLSN